MKLMLFDIDGTLLISQGLGREAKARAMRQVFGTDGGVRTFPFGGKTDWQILNETLAPHGITSEAIGAKMPEYQAIFAHYMQALVPEFETRPLEGAHDVIALLRAREDVLLGLITGNSHDTAPIKLRAGGFEPSWFKVGAYGNESHNRNDLAHLALMRAVQHYGAFAPQDVYVIGDTLADLECARSIGATCIIVTTGFEDKHALESARPDVLIHSLAQFFDHVRL